MDKEKFVGNKANKEYNRRAFAAEQFTELLRMGLSKRMAGGLMRKTGPSLAVRCLEWTRSSWQHFEEKFERISSNPLSGEKRMTYAELRDLFSDLLDDLATDLALSPMDDSIDLIRCFNAGKKGLHWFNPPFFFPVMSCRNALRFIEGVQVLVSCREGHRR